MSFICVDFYGARQMAGEIEAMSKRCAAMADDIALEELKALAADLAGIAADVRRAADEKEQEDTATLQSMRPDYSEVIK